MKNSEKTLDMIVTLCKNTKSISKLAANLETQFFPRD